jgi:acyl-CoA thioester hydrolase/thioesterase-3
MPLSHELTLGRTRFETELQVRPDDIDMNQHVHNSRNIDYVLATRYDQMARCYGMPMEEFTRLGLAWVVKTAHVEFKRPLNLGETIVVRTWVDSIHQSDVRVRFEIRRRSTGKLASDGSFDYTLISLATGRATPIPPEIAQKYAI